MLKNNIFFSPKRIFLQKKTCEQQDNALFYYRDPYCVIN